MIQASWAVDETVVDGNWAEGGVAGRERAFRSLLDLCDDEFLVRFIQTHLPRSLRRTLSAADVLQDVRLRIWQKQDQFRGQTTQQYRTWALQIARHCMIDDWRKCRRTCPGLAPLCDIDDGGSEVFDHDEPSPLARAICHEQQQMLTSALDSLPTETRRIVRLRFLDEWTYAQIAAELHLPVTTCRRRCEHGCQLLSQRLSLYRGELTLQLTVPNRPRVGCGTAADETNGRMPRPTALSAQRSARPRTK